jgi:hypothetical protein
MNLNLIAIILLLFTHTEMTYSQTESKIISPKEIKLIEDRVQKELVSKNLDEKKKFYLNLLAARELYQYRFYDKSEIYYLNAIKMNIEEDKTEALINLIAIAIIKKDKTKVQMYFDQANNYFNKYPKYKNKEIDYYLKSIENYLPLKNGIEPKAVSGFYGRFTHEESLINLLKNKEYHKAFSTLNPAAMKNSDDDFNITVFDSLNVLINKKSVKELYCNKQYKKYPSSYAYNIIICGLLNDYLQKGKFENKHLKNAEKYFNNDDKEKLYLLTMVKEIN